MNYFVTGATGFLGRHLLDALLARPEAEVYVLVRPTSRERFDARLGHLGAARRRVHVVEGDITRPGLMDPVDRQLLIGRIDHVFHLAAVYDMNMSEAAAERVNVQGTREVVDFANALGGSVRLHHVSSIAVAGPYYDGVFGEDCFDEGQELDHPYYRSKFVAEQVVREHAQVPYRVYRPGIVVGHSRTGAIDKIDGPYYFFGAVRRLATFLPRFLALPMVEGGRMPVVPVDYVVSAIDAIAHRRSLPGRVFSLVPARPPSVGELVEQLFRVAGGPAVVRVAFAPAARLANGVARMVGRCTPDCVGRRLSALAGVPVSVFGQMFTQTTYDDRQTRLALAGTGIECPDFADYIENLWRGWSQHTRGEAVTTATLPEAPTAPPRREPSEAPTRDRFLN